MKLLSADRSTMATTIRDRIAGGSAGSPKIEFYTGTQPSSMGGAIGDTLLGTLTLTNTVGTVTGGVLTFDTITDDSSADANGDIGWARVLDRDGAEACYFTVADNGTGDINFSNKTVTQGQPVGISSLTVTIGGA
jgi:hypothetical protein